MLTITVFCDDDENFEPFEISGPAVPDVGERIYFRKYAPGGFQKFVYKVTRRDWSCCETSTRVELHVIPISLEERLKDR